MITITTISSLAHVVVNAKALIRLAESEHNAARAELLASDWDRTPLAVPGAGTVSYVGPKASSVSVDRPALDAEVQRAAGMRPSVVVVGYLPEWAECPSVVVVAVGVVWMAPPARCLPLWYRAGTRSPRVGERIATYRDGSTLYAMAPLT